MGFAQAGNAFVGGENLVIDGVMPSGMANKGLVFWRKSVVTPPVLRGTNMVSGDSTTTGLTVPIPSTAQAGDFAILLTSTAWPNNQSTPTGWTNIGLNAGNYTWNQFGYSKILNSSDIATGSVYVKFGYTFGTNDSYNAVLAIVVFQGPTGGIRENQGGMNTGNDIAIVNTTTSAVTNTDVAIYWASGRLPATGLTITSSAGALTSLQTESTNTLTQLASQKMPGGSVTVTNHWVSAGGEAVASNIIVKAALPPVTWSVVSSYTGYSGSSGGITTSPINTTGANLIVIALAEWNVHGTITDNFGNTFTAGSFAVNGRSVGSIYYCISPVVGSGHTFTNTGGYPGIAVFAMKSSSGTPSVDQNSNTGVYSSVVSSIQLPSVTPGGPDALIFSAYASDNSNAISIDSGFTMFAAGQQPTSEAGAVAYLVQSTLGPIAPTWTLQANNSSTTVTLLSFLSV